MQLQYRTKPTSGLVAVLAAFFLALTLLLALPGGAVAAGVFYVDITLGDDTSVDGSETNPWKTLHHAADMLVESGSNTLHVAAGVYSVANGESVDLPISFYMFDSEILGDPNGGTIIDLTGAGTGWTNGLELYGCSNVLIKDITIRNADNNGIYVSGSSMINISGCKIHDNGGAGIYMYNCEDTYYVRGNVLYDNLVGIKIESDIYMAYGNYPQIINNLIYSGPGASLNTAISISTTADLSPTIYHNTINGGTGTGIAVINNGEPPVENVAPDIRYNLITYCNTGIALTNTSPTVDYNNLFGNATAYSGITAPPNDISADPLYNDPANYDFHLLGHSPCIDAAVTSNITTDLDGKIRPQGTYPDIGCYEFLPDVNLPPDPPSHVSPAPFQVFAPGEPVTLQASEFSDPEGDDHLTTNWLVTRADIGRFDQAITGSSPFNYLATGTDLISYTIAGENFIEGMAYEWIMGYQDSGSLQYSWPEAEEDLRVPTHVFLVGHLRQDPVTPVGPGEVAADYRMISVNHIPENPTASAVLGRYLVDGYDTTQYRIGIYDCGFGEGAYREYPDFMIAPGGAAWVLARNGLNAYINGVPVTTAYDVEINLGYNETSQNGWNMIGPPNARDYLWEDVEVVFYDESGQIVFSSRIGDLGEFNSLIDIRLWEWKNGEYDDGTIRLVAGRGYWVRAKGPGLNLRFPVAAQATWSNPGVMLALGLDRIKRAAEMIIPPATAIAADDDVTPPYPMAMATLETSSDNSRSSFHVGCFVSTLTEK